MVGSTEFTGFLRLTKMMITAPTSRMPPTTIGSSGRASYQALRFWTREYLRAAPLRTFVLLNRTPGGAWGTFRGAGRPAHRCLLEYRGSFLVPAGVFPLTG